MVTGSVASAIYGEPRLTQDIEVVLSLGKGDAERLVAAFRSGDFYVPPVEVVVEEGGRSSGGHFTCSISRVDCGSTATLRETTNSTSGAWTADDMNRSAAGRSGWRRQST